MIADDLAPDAAAPKGASGADGKAFADVRFGVGLGAAAVLTGAATLAAMTGEGPLADGDPRLAWPLAAALVLMVGLGALLARRIWRIANSRDVPETGARLHLRFVSLFSLAAVAPAVIVALFLGATLSRGVEQWFSERVKTAVEGAASVGRSYVEDVSSGIASEVQAMALDLNDARVGLDRDAPAYGRYLADQASQRFFASAHVIDRSGAVLAEARTEGAPALLPPEPADFADAEDTVLMRLFESEGVIRALYRLDAYEDAYLMVSRAIDPGMLEQLRQYEGAVVAYRAAESRRARVQTLLVMSYLATALLVLLGAVWLGLANASRVAEPIGRLAEAARRVAAGDLAARVGVSAERDEVDALGRAFNRMTAQLETQRSELVSAQQDAEARSRFIRAVLTGVSAGVIGLDGEGRVTVANRVAAELLGVADGALEGRRLVEIAPEFTEVLQAGRRPDAEARARVDLERGGVRAHLSVQRSDDPSGAGLVLTFDDVTKLIAAQRQEAWKDVARRIAHEIKNPLTPIQLSAERLQRKYAHEIKTDPEVFSRCTATILRQVADIGRMVDEFSAFARMPAPRLTRTDVVEIANQAAFAQRLAFADVTVTVTAPDGPAILWCDERLIAQALTNLLKNAGEAIQARRAIEGEPKTGRIDVAIERGEGAAAISVVDNGIGFPAQNRARLVEPYVTTRTRGTGLGLAIVQRVVEDHGGVLELADAPHRPGAMVRILLPINAEPENDAQVPLTREEIAPQEKA